MKLETPEDFAFRYCDEHAMEAELDSAEDFLPGAIQARDEAIAAALEQRHPQVRQRVGLGRPARPARSPAGCPVIPAPLVYTLAALRWARDISDRAAASLFVTLLARRYGRRELAEMIRASRRPS